MHKDSKWAKNNSFAGNRLYAIECIHPSQDILYSNKLISLAKQYALKQTGGSDLGKEPLMKIEIQSDGIWYHGSNMIFSELRTGSTITQWRELAEAFSHQPSGLGYDDNGVITHNGVEKGYLYIIDEPIVIGTDIYPHPHTTMDKNAEFLTKRPLKVKMI